MTDTIRYVANAMQIHLCDNILPMHAIAQVISFNQAQVLGLNKGVIAPSFDGDIIALNKKLEVTHTIVGGKLVYMQ